MSDLHVLSGSDIALAIRKELRQEIAAKKLVPGLAIILVGDDPASKLYVKLKKIAAKELVIEFHEYLLDEDCSINDIKDTISFLNKDDSIHGIVVQLPLPKGFDEDDIISEIDPKKDADGFHAKNLELYKKGEPYVVPALVQTIMRFVEETGEPLSGKRAVVVANSSVFAEPLHTAFEKKGAMSQFIQPNDNGFSKILKDSDVVVVAVGSPGTVRDEDCKKDSIVIDVGINTEDGKTCGDVELPENLDDVKNIKWITTVPGGVGPLTIAMLLKNVVYFSKTIK